MQTNQHKIFQTQSNFKSLRITLEGKPQPKSSYKETIPGGPSD